MNEPLADPALDVFGPDGIKITQNTSWLQALEPVFAEAGASPLPRGSQDAALVLTVTGGNRYSLVVRSGDLTEGEALLEIYELP